MRVRNFARNINPWGAFKISLFGIPIVVYRVIRSAQYAANS